MQAASMLSMATSLKSCSSEQTSRLYLIFSKCLLVMIQLSLLPGMLLLLQPLDTEAARRSCNIRGKDNVIRLNDLSGYLNLPNQTDNLSCTWIITVPEGNLVMLKTHYYSLFDNSSVQIRDGQDSSSEILETYAGDGTKKVSYTVISSGRHLWARFQSFREKFNLFLAKYEAVKNTVVGSCRKDKIVELNETSGKIFSPMYPRDFPRGTSCTWLITAPEGLHVRLKLKKTELDGGCLSALYIRNGKDSSSPLLQKYCGQEPDKASSVFSSDRYLWVNFSSKNAVKGDYHAPGFRAEYEVVQHLPAPFSCKFRDGPLTLYGASGNLASYIYPLPCDESIICIWKFMMSSEYEIELSFDSFDLSYSNLSYSNCTDDYVEIRRVKYCGSNAPPTVTLDRSSMSVTFRSSGKGTYPGFKASYTSKRTTASVLKSVALCLGFLLILCIATFFCWKCMKSEEEDKEETGHASGTECTQVSNEPGSAM